MTDTARTTGRLERLPSDIDADGLLTATLLDGVVCGRISPTTEGADVIRHRKLLALLTGCMMGLTGCQSSWQDRVDSRPMLYGSLSDKFAYWTGGPCDGYRPAYHCGSPGGLLDRKAVHHASISGANQALDSQFGGDVSRDFRYGFQQAFLDIANGGSGALPAVPPSRYWTAAYRTTWGHNKAREWFEGYEAGANAAKCSALKEAQSVPTAAYRGPDHQVSIGLDGGGSVMGSAPMNSAPFAAPMNSAPAGGWYPPGASPYPVSPYSSSPYVPASPHQPASPYSTSPYSANPYHATPAPYAVPTQPPPMNSWPTSSSSEGHSLSPGIPFPPEPATSNMTPANTAPASNGLPTSNPWNRFMGFGPNGFRSEGASR